MSNTLYKVTSGQTSVPLASDVNQYADALTGASDIGAITFAAPITAPSITGVTAAVAAGTTLGIGVYRYKITYVVGIKRSDNSVVLGNETDGSASVSVTTTTGNQNVLISGLPTVWPSTAVALRIYRTAVGGADGTQKMIATITTAVSSYTDSTADGALGAAIPTLNATGTTLTLAEDPTAALGAVTKQYADAISAVANAALPLAGGTLTGALTAPSITLASGYLVLDPYSAAQNDGTTLKTYYDGTNKAFRLNRSDAVYFDMLIAGYKVWNASNLPNPAQTTGFTNTGTISGGTVNPTTLQRGGNTAWARDDLRWNVDHLEYNNGGTWTPVGGVKSVQRGSALVNTNAPDGSINITISSVDINKSVVILPDAGGSTGYAYAHLTSATNLQYTPYYTSSTTSRYSAWQVVEYY